MGAVQLHIALPLGLALLLGHAPLGHVVLLKSTLREVRLGSPADLRSAHVFKGLAGLDGVQALLRVARLVGADIALQTGHEIY